jgi:hypothetical protein
MKEAKLKEVIVTFLEYLDQEDSNLLESVINLDSAIEFLGKSHISNGLSQNILKKAKKFVDELQDPRTCWKYLSALDLRAEPALVDLKNLLVEKVNQLVSGIDEKRIPKWLPELFKRPKEVPEGYREFFRKKARGILDFLNSVHISDQPATRTGDTKK